MRLVYVVGRNCLLQEKVLVMIYVECDLLIPQRQSTLLALEPGTMLSSFTRLPLGLHKLFADDEINV
jgi:hypothetical protein